MLSLVETTVDQIGIEERVSRLQKRSLKKNTKKEAIQLAIRMVDLTTLEGRDSPGKVSALCRKAICPQPGDSDVPSVAAVCVYPNMVATAKKALVGSTVKVASVATGFPSGQVPLAVKIEETRFAVSQGADEIDMVIDRGAFLTGDFERVSDEIHKIKEACGPAHLKVILETGELGSYDHVRQASILAMTAGADFIKTSTGKVGVNATQPVTLVMLEAIRDYWYATGKKIGMKPAGGIRTSKEALQYLVLIKETLGSDWLTPELFRFGASTLLNDLLMQLTKEKTGRYQSLDYFTAD